MSEDPGDLARLADLALPPAVPFWPPAAGIWIVGGAVIAMLAIAGIRALRRYRADAYLRAAAAELDVSVATSPSGIDTVEAVSAILKRAAMVTYGRERVAALTGPSWASFVAQTAPPGARTDVLAAGLERLFACPESTAGGDAGLLFGQAKAWLRGQRGRAGSA
ncbi:protein of unknown function [Bosea sp. CRIB-10]|uniref:DUF4381 domain-containing protein n=1 Tax=Bosea sp. CRIB-10 TaxID=378404 RepID=UPI0008EDD1F4|nr:DUF4381 domain-containing protein [Bosea sp. CRIB-10]SFD66708.1 protein of unknown function [Bosea sp. CRIB-10]